MTVLSQTARRTTAFKRATFATVLMGGLLLTACGTNPMPDPIVDPPITAPTISSVTVTPAAPSITVGATQKLTAEVKGGGAFSTAVTWKSSNEAVATVDSTGLVTAKTAGTAIITATSSADVAQSGSVTVTVKAAVVTPPPFATVKVNFQPADSAIPAGYTADIGAAYTAAKASGWVTEASAGTATPVGLDLTLNTRDRKVGGVAQELNTFIHMQYSGPTGNPTPGAWEYTVPNGTYAVTVAVGDASFIDSTHTINIEGKPAIAAFMPPSATEQFKTVTVNVAVADGRLTLDAKTGKNTKLDYVTIAAAAK